MGVSGVNQNVEVFGRTFHVQTEMISGDRALVRTTVFVGGRIIGVRETKVADLSVPDDELNARINAQHALIVENLHQRIERFQSQRSAAAPLAAGSSLLGEIPDLGAVERPVLDGSPSLGASIRVRRLVARFRGAVDLTPPRGPDDLSDRLEGALALIEEVVGFPTFADIRIDEQVRFNILRDRIRSWVRGEGDHEDGVVIWSDVAVFSSYLGRVNDRRDLIAFDRQMVRWALSIIAAAGTALTIGDQLGALYGRDLELDTVIESGHDADDDEVIRILLRLFAEMR